MTNLNSRGRGRGRRSGNHSRYLESGPGRVPRPRGFRVPLTDPKVIEFLKNNQARAEVRA
jgi:hypothetical protein